MRAVIVNADNEIVTVCYLAPDWQEPKSPNYWPLPEDYRALPHEEAGHGWTFDGTNFISPTPPPDFGPGDPPPPSEVELLSHKLDALISALATGQVISHEILNQIVADKIGG